MNRKYEWIGDLIVYLNILEQLNKLFDELMDSSEHDDIEEKFFYMSAELLRLIPFKEERNGSFRLCVDDGICLLSSSIEELISDMDSILLKHKDILSKIKRIRNKYEHEPHRISAGFTTGSASYKAIGFYYKDEFIPLDTMDLTYIIFDINIMFEKIRKKVIEVKINEISNLSELDIMHIKNIETRKIQEYNNKYTIIPKSMWY